MTGQFAAMIIFYNGRYLFEVRSSPLEQKGLLALPGGKWQAVDGPRLEATAAREVQEELGVCLGAQSSASVDFVPCGRDFGVTLVRTFIANRPLDDSEYAKIAWRGILNPPQVLVWLDNDVIQDANNRCIFVPSVQPALRLIPVRLRRPRWLARVEQSEQRLGGGSDRTKRRKQGRVIAAAAWRREIAAQAAAAAFHAYKTMA